MDSNDSSILAALQKQWEKQERIVLTWRDRRKKEKE